MRALALLLLCGWAFMAQAADEVFTHPATTAEIRTLLSAPAQQLQKSAVLRGRFTQQKRLRELPAPLRSEGRFLFARDRGISWHTLKPFDSELLLTPAGIVQKDGGRTALQLSADQQPALQVALRLFVALFSLDVEALSRDFDLYGVSSNNTWQLGLKPKNAMMGAAFTQAIVSGDKAVQRIDMLDRNGDRTQIDIVELQAAAAATPADLEAFKK